MKKAKILTVFGVLLAMGMTACGKKAETSESSKSEAPVSSSSEAAPASSESTAPADTSSQESVPGFSSSSSSGQAHTHKWVDPEVTKEATCTEAGTKLYYCDCGDTKTEIINALGHKWSEWEVKTEATCSAEGLKERVCTREGCVDPETNAPAKETQVIAKVPHDFGEDAVKVDLLEEEGAVKEEMYKCKNCDVTSVRWSATDYDATKTAARSTKSPESRGSGKAVRFDSTANYQDADATKKGCHIVYNVYIPEPAEHLSIYMKTSKRTDSTLPPVVNMVEGDNAKGYEYVDGELVRPATRYGLKIDGEVIIVPEDTSGQEWKDGINWYTLPGDYSFETAGVHEIEFYNLGGYRADFYEFALVGFGPHEHVAKYEAIDAKLNSDNKTVVLAKDKFNDEKAIEVAFKDYSTEPSKTPSGTNPWYLAKDSDVTWKVSVDKAIEGAKLYFSLECSSDTHLERHLFNEAQWNAAHPDEQVKLPSQSPDTVDEADWRYSIAVGETEYPILNNKTMGESGVKEKNVQTYVYFGDINLAAGENVIKLTQNNIGYRMKFNQNVRIVYNSDAVLTGDHAHIFNQFVSETAATCESKGSKVMKCFSCDETDTVETPALGHDYQVGEPDANGISAVTCKREGCTLEGIQFDGFTGDNATAIDGDNKVTKKCELKWNVTMPKAGKVALYMSFAYSAYNGGQKFGTGYAIKVGETDGTITLGDVAFNTLIKQDPTCTFVQIGTVDVTAGAIEIDYTHGNQGTRLVSDKLVRLIYVD